LKINIFKGLILGWIFGLGLDLLLGCGWIRRKKAIIGVLRLNVLALF
jgi:hypothetical protein